MKNNSKDELKDVVVETVTVVEEKVPVYNTTVVEETVPVETLVTDNNVPVESNGESGTVTPNENVVSNSDNGHVTTTPQTVENSSNESTTDTSTPKNNGESVVNNDSHGNSNNDDAESKLKENSGRSPSANNQNASPRPNNSSDAANRLRNNNGNNRNNGLRNNNPNPNNNKNNGQGNNNENKGLNNSDKNGLSRNGDKNADDKAKKKLLDNKANKARNLPFHKKKNNNQESSDNSSANDNNDNNSDDSRTGEEKTNLKQKIKKITTFVIIAAIAVFFLLIIIIVLLVVAVLGGGEAFSGFDSTLGNSTITDSPNEEKYYEKLDEVVAEYRKSCGVSLNKYYIHAFIIYPIDDYEELFETSNFSTLSRNVDTVATLFVDNCSVDYEVGGISYNRIKSSSFFKEYYKDMLTDLTADEILEEVFSLAEFGTEMFANDWYINDNLKVNLITCASSGGTTLNQGSIYSSQVGFSEYIMGVINGEVVGSISEDTIEFIKAHIIISSSYALSRAGYQPGDTEITVGSGTCWQAYCDYKEGCHQVKEYDSITTDYTGPDENGRFHLPKLSDKNKNILMEAMEEVFGMLILDNSGNIMETQYRNSGCPSDLQYCMTQVDAANDARNGMTYEEIISKYYGNVTITNAEEDLYADVEYEEGGYNEKVVFYDQNDYGDVVFCGRTKDSKRPGTIKSSGCGTTAMSIILSTLVDKTFTPPVVMEEAYGFGSCGVNISGTSTSFFEKSAKLHNLSYKSVGKKGNLQIVLDALKSGNSLVIAHMGQVTFTGSGHYIVLSRVNEQGQVYVYDPYHAVNVVKRKSGNGWYDFNSVIVKQLNENGKFHIITKG